jgi:hypothetical protein
VVTLRVLAHCLGRAGDEPAATMAARQAYALSSATEMRSEIAASRRVFAERPGQPRS